MIRDHIEVLEQGLDGNEVAQSASEEELQETKEMLREALARRRAFIKWLEAQPDDTAFIGIYPGWPDDLLYREDLETHWRELDDKSPLVFFRLKKALDDDAAYWELIRSRLAKRGGHNLADGMRSWGVTAYQASQTLRYEASLESIDFGQGLTEHLPQNEWSEWARTDIVFQGLSLEVSREAIDMALTATFRCAEVVKFVTRTRLPSDVAAFLERLATLYIWGFDSETYALARSVIESALKSQMPDALVWRFLPDDRRGRRFLDLNDRIDAARRAGLINKDVADLARMIRQDGNDVLHEFPNSNLHHSSALAVIEHTALVVGRILRGGRETGRALPESPTR
jgi:hypothetical protein